MNREWDVDFDAKSARQMGPSCATPFAPRLWREPLMDEFYDDGRVRAAVNTVEAGGVKSIVIHEWSSQFPGSGHTVEALAWMRKQGFTHIVANGVGDIDEEGVGDISVCYWQHMRAKGLVDVLLDDAGRDVTPNSASSCQILTETRSLP